MTEVEKWKRLTNPKTVEDWCLSVDLCELVKTNEGWRIVTEEIIPEITKTRNGPWRRP